MNMHFKNTGRNADIILYGGKIISCDAYNRIYQAIAIKNQKILFLGSDQDTLAFKNESTKCINLYGKTVIPGMIDSHTHFSTSALSEIYSEVFIPNSVKELLDNIRDRVRRIREGEWIYYPNTYPTRLEEKRFPRIEELDAVSPLNPVYIDGAYVGQANSCALKTAGINEDTVPVTGKLGKDEATGKLNGLLFSCDYLIKKHMKAIEYTREDVIRAIEVLQRNYNRLGITSIIDGITPLMHIEAYNELFRRGRLNIRVAYTYMAEAGDDIKLMSDRYAAMVATPPEWGKCAFLKNIVDGGILTGTAYMKKPYGDKWKRFNIEGGCYHGTKLLETDDMVNLMKIACEKGLQATAHCIGDAAVELFLDAVEQVNKSIPVKDKRFSIIHADFTDEDALQRIKESGIVLISQPAWHYKDSPVINSLMEEDVMKTFLPYKKMQEMDIRVSAGSDHMIKHDPVLSHNPYNPFIGIYNLVTRKTERGEVIQPAQKISRERALKMYTIEGAYASFDENIKGTLEPGKLADLVVLSHDYFTCPEDDILNIESELTIIDGRIVFEK